MISQKKLLRAAEILDSCLPTAYPITLVTSPYSIFPSTAMIRQQIKSGLIKPLLYAGDVPLFISDDDLLDQDKVIEIGRLLVEASKKSAYFIVDIAKIIGGDQPDGTLHRLSAVPHALARHGATYSLPVWLLTDEVVHELMLLKN